MNQLVIVGDSWYEPYGSLGKMRAMVYLLCSSCANIYGPTSLGRAKYRNKTTCNLCSNRLRLEKARIIAIDKLLAKVNNNILVDTTLYLNENSRLQCSCRICGNSWTTSASSLKTGAGCPKCAIAHNSTKRKAIAKSTFLEDVARIHNNTVFVDINTYDRTDTHVDATCICGHTWKVTPTNLKSGYGCPKCNTGWSFHKKDITTPTMLYLLYLPDYKVYKIGITSKSIKARYAREKCKIIEVLKLHFSSGAEAYKVEQILKTANSAHRYIGEPILNGGNTELFSYINIGNVDTLHLHGYKYLQELKESNGSTRSN